MSTISFDEFKKLDLRTGTIETVEEHPNADKLLILQINVGGEIKQSCAGLKEYYSPEELEGKKVVVLNNLETAELRGEKSECMILAADGESVVVIQPEKEVDNGVKVR